MISKVILLAISAFLIGTLPVLYVSNVSDVSGYFIGFLQKCRPIGGGDPGSNGQICCKPIPKRDSAGNNILVQQCYDCSTNTKTGEETCICLSNCGDRRAGLLNDRIDSGGLVNERPDTSTKGSPDTNIGKNGGILIDRGTSIDKNSTNSTTTNVTMK